MAAAEPAERGRIEMHAVQVGTGAVDSDRAVVNAPEQWILFGQAPDRWIPIGL